MFQHALDEYTDFVLGTQAIPEPNFQRTGPVIVAKEAEPEGGIKSLWRRLIKRTLKAGDVILDSLAGAFPPLHAVKEFKEAGESGLELGESIGGGIGEALKPKRNSMRRTEVAVR